MRNFIIAALDDENGINADAYHQLRAFAEISGDCGVNIDDIIACIQSANGRYFLPEDHELKA